MPTGLPKFPIRSQELLAQALTHASYAVKYKKSDNERLEFLGDAILSTIAAEVLFAGNPTLPEGELTRLRSQAVQGKALAAAARKLGLEPHLRHELNAPAPQAIDRLLEQAFESLVGAIFLENGFEKTKEIVLPWLSINSLSTPSGMPPAAEQFNPKGRLQEILQPKVVVEEIEYRLEKEEGPHHSKVFTIGLYIKGKLTATASAPSKKEAEEKAAQEALIKFKKQ